MWVEATQKNMPVETACRDQDMAILLFASWGIRQKSDNLVLVLLFLCVSCSLGFRN